MYILSPPPISVCPSHHCEEDDEAILLPDDLAKLSSDTHFAIALPSSSSGGNSMTTPSLKRRKRVHFDVSIDDDKVSSSSSNDCLSATSPLTTDRPVKRRVVEWLPLCNELPEEEKNQRWIQQDEHTSIRARMSEQAALSRRKDAAAVQAGQPELSFSETYAQVVGLCHHSTADDDTKSEDSSCSTENSMVAPVATTTTTSLQQQGLPDLLASMAVGRFAENRGLEDRTVPLMALERRFARAKTIRAVVECQHHTLLTNSQDSSVADLARALSEPSRKLAECLAVVDATAAMMEYARDVTAANMETS